MAIAATIVIATRNRAEQLKQCLAALARQTAVGSFETVVVDNGSSDATREVITNAVPAGVRGIYVGQPNRAKARNAGIAAAKDGLIIFCDDDTVAPERFVAAHLEAHVEHSNAVVSGPIINVPDPTLRVQPSRRHWSRAFFCTCNASVARHALRQAGGFDEEYDLYGWEDTDLGVRLRAQGLRRIFSWSAYIYHIKPSDTLALERRQALAKEKGTMAARFVRKSPTWQVKLATGAYALNFARAAMLTAPPFRALYQRLVRTGSHSVVSRLAADALVDASYVGALRAALHEQHAAG